MRKETFGVRRVLGDPVTAVYPGFSKAIPAASDIPSTLNLYWRFFLAGITRHGQTGALLPSQRFLIERMIAPVPRGYSGQVLELGAGTGVLTLRLARKRPACRVLACEINTALAREVHGRMAAAGLQHRVRIVSHDAEQLLAQLREQPVDGRPDFIISGIPLGNLGKDRAEDLIYRVWAALKPGGLYIQFQHSLLDQKKIQARFARLRTTLVLPNIPPAFVYYAWK